MNLGMQPYLRERFGMVGLEAFGGFLPLTAAAVPS